MAAMTATETWDFLMEGTRTAHVATVRADGRPHIKPVWFELAGPPGDFQVVFTTAANTVAGRNLRRDGRVTLSVDDPVPPFAFVLIEGSAGLSDDPAELLAPELAGRHAGLGLERAIEGSERLKTRVQRDGQDGHRLLRRIGQRRHHIFKAIKIQ